MGYGVNWTWCGVNYGLWSELNMVWGKGWNRSELLYGRCNGVKLNMTSKGWWSNEPVALFLTFFLLSVMTSHRGDMCSIFGVSEDHIIWPLTWLVCVCMTTSVHVSLFAHAHTYIHTTSSIRCSTHLCIVNELKKFCSGVRTLPVVYIWNDSEILHVREQTHLTRTHCKLPSPTPCAVVIATLMSQDWLLRRCRVLTRPIAVRGSIQWGVLV